MKTVKALIFGVIITNLLIFCAVMQQINRIENKVDKITKDTLIIKTPVDTAYKSTYNYILPKIKKFNEKADTSAIKRIAEVMHFYKLDKNKKRTNLFIGQILQESGANQYYYSGHPLEGQLVVSCGGAIGITQITSYTAFCYMTKIITEKDKKDMLALGCNDFKFVNKKGTVESKLPKVKEWLKNKDNNIVLWGYIVQDILKKVQDINKTLIAYNVGLGGLKTYLDSGCVVSEHEYVININKKLSRVSAL